MLTHLQCPGDPTCPRPEPDDRRASLVEVTIPLLREHGAGLTTRQVAEAAGIAEGTVFRAFGSKEELVQACAAAVFDTSDVLAELRGIDRSLSLDERLAAAVTIMQIHVERIIGVLSTLRSTGAMPPRRTTPTSHVVARTPRSTRSSSTSSATTRPRSGSRRRTSSTSCRSSRSRASTRSSRGRP